MASYVVMEPASDDGGGARSVFVRDGVTVIAFFIPFVWLLWHRLWFAAGMVLLAGIAIGLLGEFAELPVAISIISLLLSALVALEGNEWRMASLERRGYVEKAVIDAEDEEEAEIRYFAGLTLDGNGVAGASSAQPQRASVSAYLPRKAEGLGLVGYRGEG
ncbi:MAG: DUF2628 domain-containing protein [Phyllobacterium sp.]